MAVLGLLALAFIVVESSVLLSGGDRPSQAVEAAKRDLAQRIGVSEGDIELVGEVEAVTWSDASLGCPEPGKMYAQVLTPGFRFALKAGGNLYKYHTGKGAVKLCK